MNNKGKGSGLALVLILIVALLIAYLAVTQMGSLGFGNGAATRQEAQQNRVREAQDAVDQLNDRMQQVVQDLMIGRDDTRGSIGNCPVRWQRGGETGEGLGGDWP